MNTQEITTAEPAKQDLLIRYLFTEPNTLQAAIKAGYAESTANSTIYTLIKKPEFQTRLREYAIANDLLSVPQLQKIENSCLKLVEADPKQYPKFKEIFRQKKQIAGLLEQDTQPRQPMINIRSIENLQVVVSGDLEKRLK